jgi:predicted metal-binding membrane protein
MSIAWMLVVAVLIATEKLLPWRAAATDAVTAALLALGIAVAAAPGAFMG